MTLVNAMTVDLEDWYQGIEQPFNTWGNFRERITIGTDRLLQLLDEVDIKATFFVLGWLSEKYPHLIRRIAESGHEVASHGYDHEKLYDITPDMLRKTLSHAKKATEDATGQVMEGHRAPYFTLTRQSLWAIDILNDLGFRYDSSIYPGENWRYGIPDTPETLYKLAGTDIIEFPVSTMRLCGRKLGIGGAYFRILPLRFTLNAIQEINTQGRPVSFYIHPWEFDPMHPLVRFRWKAMLTHYFNLWSTAPRFAQLLKQARFTTMHNVIASYSGVLDSVTFTLPRPY